jgi:predicted NBD/HSP70 family sugar kinase
MIKRRSLREQHFLTEHQQKSFQILELIRRHGPMTRTELSQSSGFNIVTVSNYITHFIKQGLVSEQGFDISTGGRKPVLVDLNAKAGFAIGVNLGPMDVSDIRTVSVITDLRGQIVHRLVKPRATAGLDRVLQEAEGVIRELLKTSPVDTKKILGIGFGLPGIMDEPAGTVRDTSYQGTRVSYVAVRDRWEAELRLPVLMGNDATLAGYGEMCLGLDRLVENCVYFYSDVGASLMFNGQIYWGSGGSAGELGIFAPSDDDYLTWVKSPQFVMANAWDLGLVSQAKKLIREGHATAIQKLVNGKLDTVNLDTVLQAANDGDQLARELIEHHAMHLGIRVAFLVNLLNPDVVVIGGGIERAGSMLLEPVWRAAKKYAYEEPASLVDISPAQLGENAAALGAACWVIREAFIQA